ncbi:MAG TPA: peptidoglycan-binding domain-containing protein [bacterium]|nr:peptidoglycan-binding domain-containing protein [bacterium]
MTGKYLTGILLVALTLPAVVSAQGGRYGGHALEFGSRDSDFAADYVTLLQTDLSKLGYDDYLLKSGKLESAFGPATEAAVKAFQRDWGLPVTGVVGAETTAALERAVAGGRPESTGPPPKLTLLESAQITVKAGQKGTYDIKPVQGTTYVISCGGDCLEANVVNPYEAYARVVTPPADVRFALAELGDDGKAVIFDDVPFAGRYFVEVEPLNDLKDTPVLLRIYELTR